MKLGDIYVNKLCPHQPRYKCDGSLCVKFISCMMTEIDALYTINGIDRSEADELDKELTNSLKYDTYIQS